jgi:hypothetical protein
MQKIQKERNIITPTNQRLFEDLLSCSCCNTGQLPLGHLLQEEDCANKL